MHTCIHTLKIIAVHLIPIDIRATYQKHILCMLLVIHRAGNLRTDTSTMCGIAGFLDKTGAGGNTGAILVSMLQALAPRGPDGTGAAVYGPPVDGFVLRIKVGEEAPEPALLTLVQEVIGEMPGDVQGAYLQAVAPFETDLDVLAEALAEVGSELVSAGRQLEIVKGTGSPEALDTTYNLSSWTGTHALGHTRMSTESKIDLSHSQPFWAKGYPDLAIVHNGHITNYHKLRRMYEEQGVRFYTENDSEVIGIYLRDQLSRGSTLEEALQASIGDFDGSYCYLAATTDTMAFVKDPFGFKPLVMAETDEFVAVATEEIALRAALSGSFTAREPAARAVYLWTLPVGVAA